MLAVPATLKVVIDQLDKADSFDNVSPNHVSQEEISWMLSKRPLVYSKESLLSDYGEEEAQQMQNAFASIPEFLGILNYPGVGTRWRVFLEWFENEGKSMLEEKKKEGQRKDGDLRLLFSGFAQFLGRARSYRALALTPEALARIQEVDVIFPSGQLRVDEETLSKIVSQHGVRKIAVARLYIAALARLIGHDPSVSLHDDWQTTSCIAAGYASNLRPVYLFQLSVPVIESLGWRLADVAERAPSVLGAKYENHERWFNFRTPASSRGVWFDSDLQETERYGLWGIPFLSKRLERLYRFDSIQQMREAILPFVEHQERLKEKAKVCESL
eukprot:Lithocolla_globosa_v1_NODE_4789_length_1366_cov_7.829138.p1 type:complete len:329 gc:universal NODE_4789_length_1366_cov_7.829138:1264-278(-)